MDYLIISVATIHGVSGRNRQLIDVCISLKEWIASSSVLMAILLEERKKIPGFPSC